MTPSRWWLACGAWFFKHRNALFPVVILLAVADVYPVMLFGNPVVDRWAGWLGAALIVAGESLRLATIGFEYIERGGKSGSVWASRLVQGGMYGLCRNPMYVANIFIVLGVCLMIRAPLVFVTVVPFFLFIYWTIVLTEEHFLRGKFGGAFEAYCRRVPRVLPSCGNLRAAFAGMRYRWWRALRQDLSTLTGVAFAIALLPLWHDVRLQGHSVIHVFLPQGIARAAVILACYLGLYAAKRWRWLEKPEGLD